MTIGIKYMVQRPRMSIASLLTLVLTTLLSSAWAQVSIDRFVIGTTGHFSEAGPVSVSGTVGEAVVPTFTFNDLIITQGFQQPSVYSELTLEIDIEPFNASCLNANDGYAVATPLNGTAPYTYSWDDNVNEADTAENLLPGIYSVLVTDAAGNTGLGTATVDADILENCGLYIWNGLTPNNDSHNDWWQIDNIEDFPNNSIVIFNRWGNLVWETEGYDNTFNRFEGKTMDGMDLPDGTYFFICTIEDDVRKGWIQLTR